MMKKPLIILLIIPMICFAQASTIMQADKLYNQYYYKAAAALYSKDLDKKPSYKTYIKLSDAYFFDALISSKSKKKMLLNQSKKAVLQAQKLKGNDAEILARLSRIYGQIALLSGGKEKIRLGNQVKKYAEQALRLKPNQSTANAVLGVWYYEYASLSPLDKTFGRLFYGKLPKGDYQQSLNYLNRAVKADPRVVFFRLALAKTLIKLKKKDQARNQIQKALALPNTVAADKGYKVELKKLLSTLN